MEALLIPPIAFLLYTAILFGVGRIRSGPVRRTPLYAGGETHPVKTALLGYRGFITFALFFAVVHLGVLMLASGPPSPAQLVYLSGLVLSLMVLLLN